MFITVARPRGIHTRFPILPSSGHPDTIVTKISVYEGGTLTRVSSAVKLNLYLVRCTLCFVVDIEYKNKAQRTKNKAQLND